MEFYRVKRVDTTMRVQVQGTVKRCNGKGLEFYREGKWGFRSSTLWE